VPLVNNISITVPVTDARKYVWRIASKTHMSDEAVNLSTQIIDRAKQHKIGRRTIIGKDSMSVAAAALYVACLLLGEKATQKEMADAAGLSKLSVTNAFGAVREEVQVTLPGPRRAGNITRRLNLTVLNDPTHIRIYICCYIAASK
jgi:transcription initiation factor TFIIB